MRLLWDKDFWCMGIRLTGILLLIASACFSASVRPAFFASSFYPSDKKQLQSQLCSFFEKKVVQELPFGLIVPHAGYIYSGRVAGAAYSLIKDRKIDTVFLIGRSHRANFVGIITDDRDAWKTPLGSVNVDTKIVSDIVVKPGFRVDYRVIDAEHSLEVQIPFLQYAIKERFKIVPLLVGCEDQQELELYANYLYPIIEKNKNFLVVMSTDLSHYYPLDIAQQKDKKFISIVESGQFFSIIETMKKGEAEACGGSAVFLGLRILSKISPLKVNLLRYSTSYETTKDKSQVVGYAAMAIYKDAKKLQDKKGGAMFDRKHREILLKTARQTLEYFLAGKKLPDLKITDPSLLEKRGVFVTLKKNGQLRGCIGMIIPHQPLIESVRSMAIESATKDPRFPAVSLKELKEIEIEISVLTTPTKVSGPDDIVLGRDGVIVRRGNRQGIFLPQVADETGWTKEKFLSALCSHKAGLEPDAWKKPDTELFTFQAEVFSEHDL